MCSPHTCQPFTADAATQDSYRLRYGCSNGSCDIRWFGMYIEIVIVYYSLDPARSAICGPCNHLFPLQPAWYDVHELDIAQDPAGQADKCFQAGFTLCAWMCVAACGPRANTVRTAWQLLSSIKQSEVVYYKSTRERFHPSCVENIPPLRLFLLIKVPSLCTYDIDRARLCHTEARSQRCSEEMLLSLPSVIARFPTAKWLTTLQPD